MTAMQGIRSGRGCSGRARVCLRCRETTVLRAVHGTAHVMGLSRATGMLARGWGGYLSSPLLRVLLATRGVSAVLRGAELVRLRAPALFGAAIALARERAGFFCVHCAWMTAVFSLLSVQGFFCGRAGCVRVCVCEPAQGLGGEVFVGRSSSASQSLGACLAVTLVFMVVICK